MTHSGHRRKPAFSTMLTRHQIALGAGEVGTDMSDDDGLDDLWETPPAARRPGPDRADESDRLHRIAEGETRAAQALLDRHLVASWQLAIAVSLDVDVATDAVDVAWARAIAAPASHPPFRRVLLREVRRAAADLPGGLLVGLDLTRSEGIPPFGADPDPSLATVAFTLMDESERAAWWLVQVEEVPNRELAALLDLPALTGLTLALDAVDGLRSGMLEAQYRSATGDCRRAVPRFAPYLDGSLVDFDVSLLHRHLGGCDGCTSRLNGLEDPVAVLTERVAPAPRQLAGRLLELLVPGQPLPPGVGAGHRYLED
jgi:DNA-directed RNA polymerase specialized sigma24 family protein